MNMKLFILFKEIGKVIDKLIELLEMKYKYYINYRSFKFYVNTRNKEIIG